MRLISIITLLFVSSQLSAQESKKSNGASIGFHLSQYQRDFGLGLNVTSPYLLKNALAITARGNLQFNEHFSAADNEIVWTPYSNVSLGIIGAKSAVGEHMKLYGEGGVIGIFPSSDFSSESFVFGGYGIFGFEFYMADCCNYFIELGGIGSGAVADKVQAKPIYSNGFLINVGYRVVF